jgi:hypothetical protein
VLAWAWGIWGVALSTLVTDLLALAWIAPRIAAPAAASSTTDLLRAVVRPLAPALVAAAVVLVGLARVWEPRTLLTLAPLGAVWAIVAAAAIWRFGLAPEDRARVGREFLRRPTRAVAAADL